MIDDFKKILDQVSEPADLATVLIFGTAGFLIDAGFNAIGFLDPGFVGVTAASGALGLKKAGESLWATRRARSAKKARVDKAKSKASRLLELLDSKNQADLFSQLKRDLELFDAEIIDVENLEASLDEVIAAYRSRTTTSSTKNSPSIAPGRILTLESDVLEEESDRPESLGEPRHTARDP